MDFELPGESDPVRLSIKRWLDEHKTPSGKELAKAGYVVPHWPKPWGLDADPLAQIVIDQELRLAGVSRPNNPIGIGWAGPTLLNAGTTEQKERYLFPIISGEEIWCQLFSEPDAGSDLASLKTKAVLDGDEYVVNGQKIWTTFGHEAQFGILIARTNWDVPNQEGITYFICPMDTPGITVTPILDMTGMHAFNQVFFDNVRLPIGNIVGQVNAGWKLAKVTLANERVSLSSEGAIWGSGPTIHDLIKMIKKAGGLEDKLLRQRVASVYTRAEILRLIRLRTVTSAIKGSPPGPESSIRKVMSDEHGQELLNLAKDMSMAGGMLQNSAPLYNLGLEGSEGVGLMWGFCYLFSPALTIGGGTAQVQRNIIAEKVLGLPKDL